MTDEVFIPLFTEAIELDWFTYGTEWVSRLREAIAAATGDPQWGGTPVREFDEAGTPRRAFELIANGVGASLIIAPVVPRGAWVFAAVKGKPVEDELRMWADTVARVTAVTGEHRDFKWAVAIGTRPRMEVHSLALAREGTCGPLRLVPVGEPYHDAMPSLDPPSLRQVSSWHCWLVVVEGETRAYDWDAASRAASRDIHALCGLLSVAWRSCWVVREALSPVATSASEIHIPVSSPCMRADRPPETGLADRQEVELPEWLDTGWARAKAHVWLADALAIYYEGAQLEYAHPSLALLAFVAAIEAVGAQLSKAERCESCGVVTGSGQRFRDALSLVVSGDEAKRLGRTYNSRSRTAHSGRLHGTEDRLAGLIMPGFFTPDQGWSFRVQDLYPLQRASQDLLVLALSDGLPTVSDDCC